MQYRKIKKIVAISIGCVALAFVFFGAVFAGPAPVAADVISLENPLGKVETIPALVNRILNGLFGIVGVIALLVLVYGGFTWMTSEGSEKKIKKGWDTMIWGALGLIIIFASYILVSFLLKTLLTETTATGAGGGGGTTTSQPSTTGGTGGTPNQPYP